MPRLAIRCFVAVLAAALQAAAGPLELRGTIDPPERAMVTIYAASRPFQKQTMSGSKGRFRFKKVPAGSYTVAVFHPRWGESRRTVEVTESFADSRGRVEVTVSLPRLKGERSRSLLRQNTVSARELRIPQKAVNLLRKARKKLGKGEVDAAVIDLEKAVEISPPFVAAWNLLGTISYQRAKFEDAEKYFRAAIEHDEDAFEPTVNLGGTLLSMGRHKEALSYNNFAVLLRPESPLANSQMGMNHFYLGDNEEALSYLAKAKRLDPSHFSNPQIIIAEIHAQQGDSPKAIQEFEEFLRLHPDSELRAQVESAIRRLKNDTSAPVASPR